jgi:hypothetical protein
MRPLLRGQRILPSSLTFSFEKIWIKIKIEIKGKIKGSGRGRPLPHGPISAGEDERHGRSRYTQ